MKLLITKQNGIYRGSCSCGGSVKGAFDSESDVTREYAMNHTHMTQTKRDKLATGNGTTRKGR